MALVHHRGLGLLAGRGDLPPARARAWPGGPCWAIATLPPVGASHHCEFWAPATGATTAPEADRQQGRERPQRVDRQVRVALILRLAERGLQRGGAFCVFCDSSRGTRSCSSRPAMRSCAAEAAAVADAAAMVDTATSEAAAAVACAAAAEAADAACAAAATAPGSSCRRAPLLRGAAASEAVLDLRSRGLRGSPRRGARARCRRPRVAMRARCAPSTLGTGVARRGAERALGGFGHRHHRAVRAPGAAMRRKAGLRRVVPARLTTGRIHQRPVARQALLAASRDRHRDDRLVDRRGGGDTDHALAGVRRRLDRDAHRRRARRGIAREHFGRDAFTRQALVALEAHRGCEVERLAEMRGVDGSPGNRAPARRPRRTADRHPRGAWTESDTRCIEQLCSFAREGMTLARP